MPFALLRFLHEIFCLHTKKCQQCKYILQYEMNCIWNIGLQIEKYSAQEQYQNIFCFKCGFHDIEKISVSAFHIL